MELVENEVAQRPLTLSVNGQRVRVEVSPGARLVDVLREAGYLEVKEGCGEGECGSCTVLLDGRAVCSCLTLVESAEEQAIVTPAVGGDRVVDALRAALVEEMGTQCGFCTPGIVLSSTELLRAHPEPDEAQLRRALGGNLCRCTGYTRVAQAVRSATAALREEPES